MSSATAVALQRPAVVRSILLHGVAENLEVDVQPPLVHEKSYGDLLNASLVCRAWRDIAQELLQKNLVFRRGKQLEAWLRSLPDDREEQRENEIVVLYDPLPFKAQKEDGDGAKWSFDVVKRALSRVKATRTLCLLFMGQKEVPGEWLSTEGLKFLQILRIGSPFSTSDKPPSFSLSALAIDDSYPRLKRDWSSTFRLFAASPSSSSLHSLDLSALPSFDKYLLDLVPFGASLQALAIPAVILSGDLWRFYPFAAACSKLHTLTIGSLRGVTPEILLAFPPTLSNISVNVVEGAPGELNEMSDTWGCLTRTLKELGGLKVFHIGEARKLSTTQYEAVKQVAEEKGFILYIARWLTCTDEEELTETQIHLASAQKPAQQAEVEAGGHETLTETEQKAGKDQAEAHVEA
ncbi:hypothetical protein JCM10213_008163 [Rhodosporidiobolus nylandii]